MEIPAKRLTSPLLALAIYQSIAIFWFGIPILDDFSHSYIGIKGSADPAGYMWFLIWWPYAIVRGLNPFITKLIWAPSGFNVTWAHCVPLPALMAAPITRLWGPVASWNVLCLIAPVLAAWCAFILCRQLCGSFIPSLIGGYLFGFSPYMLGHLLGHLSLILIFPLPLAVYLVALRLEERLSRSSFALLFAIVAIVQFLCCAELLATGVVFGAVAVAIAMLTIESGMRKPLLDVCALVVAALVIAAIPLIPFLYYAFFAGFPRGAINPPEAYSSDLLAFVVPNQLILIGQPSALSSLAMRFCGGAAEDTAYLGIPILLLTLAYGLSNWRKSLARLTILTLMTIAIASLGPTLHIAGTASIPLPWAIFTRLPIIDKALPGRFMMYAFLDAALIVALYLADAPSPIGKVLAALTMLSLIPNLPGGWWSAKVDTPRFFSNGSYKQHLAQGEIAVVLPYGKQGNSMLWQAQTDMFFRMAGGYIGLTPAEFARWPILNSLYSGDPLFDFAPQLKFFLAANDVKTIILARDARRKWPALLATLDLTGATVDDVTLYDIPRNLLKAYAGVTADEAASAAAMDAFAAMITAAKSYWARSLPLGKLNPWEAARLGLLSLPPNGAGPDPNNRQSWQNLWLGEYGDSTIGIGVSGDYAGLNQVIHRFGPAAKNIFFPYPKEFRVPPRARAAGQLLMTFDRQHLDQAAVIAATPTLQRRPSGSNY